MNLTIQQNQKDAVLAELQLANLTFQKVYPGDLPDRQPVHNVHGGANLYKNDSIVNIVKGALKSFETNASHFGLLANVLQLEGYEALSKTEAQIKELETSLESITDEQRRKELARLPYTVYKKIITNLETEACEDFRIDFEDGFGNKPEVEELRSRSFYKILMARRGKK